MESKKEYLKNVEGVVYCNTPTFVVNWETNKIYPQAYTDPSDPRDLNKSHGICHTMKFESVKKIIDFVEKNKHQIIVYAIVEHTPSVACLRFAKKPYCDLIS